MQKDIKEFVDLILSINPTVSTIYGSALTVGSRSMAGSGIGNSAGDAVFTLEQQTATLAELLTNKDSKDRDTIKALAGNIEGSLMMLQTLGQISPTFCKDLVKKLHGIVK